MRRKAYVSPMHMEIVEMLDEGKSYKEIAKIIGVSDVKKLTDQMSDIGFKLPPPIKKCSDCGVRIYKLNKPAVRSNRCRKCLNKHQNEWIRSRKV